jgi:Ca2+-binding RTX toxin-like protein
VQLIFAILVAPLLLLFAEEARATAVMKKANSVLSWNSGSLTVNQLVDVNYHEQITVGGAPSYSLVSYNEATDVPGTIGCGAARTVPQGEAISCETVGVAGWEVLGWAGDDTIRTGVCDVRFCINTDPPPVPMTVYGLGGDDTLHGGTSNDNLIGDFDAVEDVGDDTLFGGAGADTLTALSGNDTLIPGTGDDGVVDGGGGADTVSYDDGRGQGVGVTLGDGSAQNDGGPDDNDDPTQREALLNVEKVVGSGGDDTLDSRAAGDAANELDGRAGVDLIFGGLGGDAMDGEGGVDTVSYEDRVVGLTVNLGTPGADDGSSEDGPEGARDTIAGVEHVIGGSGGDTLLGGPGNDILEGRLGGDLINGFAGSDVVRGDSGVDNVEARDGVADDVDCGPDEDSALTDSVDTRVACDPPPPPPPAAPAASSAAPPASGGAAPERLRPTIKTQVEVKIESSKFKKLKVSGIESGATVAATCRLRKSRKCGTFTRTNAPAVLRLKSLEGKALPVGAKIEIRVTKPGAIGAYFLLTVRKAKKPSLTTLCIASGAMTPTRCS